MDAGFPSVFIGSCVIFPCAVTIAHVMAVMESFVYSVLNRTTPKINLLENFMMVKWF